MSCDYYINISFSSLNRPIIVQMRIGCKFDVGVPRPQIDSNNKVLVDNRNNPIPVLDKGNFNS